MGDLTASFDRSEFASPDGRAMPLKYTANLLELARQLQVVRDVVGKPISISSGYRSPAHNAAVGGVSDSRHLTAQAADFSVRGVALAEVYCAMERLIPSGGMKQGGLGIYRGHLHYDTRGSRARWNQDVPAPSCAPVSIAKREDADMAILIKVIGGGSKVWVHTGADLQRVVSGAALARLREHGIVSKAPAKAISAAQFRALQTDLGLL